MTDSTGQQFSHETVLLKEAVQQLVVDKNGFYVDGTFGRGGHSQEILAALDAQGHLLAIDKDPQAIKTAHSKFAGDQRFSIKQGSFAQLREFVEEKGLAGKVSGILLDLGVSSPQLDNAERGFSFINDGPLDMRMNPDEGVSAAEWIARADAAEIAQVLKDYGEERFAKRMARAVVEQREETPITTTKQLAEIIKEANPAWEKGKHPATRAFQGIRIHINHELDDLIECLEQSLEILAKNGRLVVISFHSLEDRIVKRFIRKHVKGDDIPKEVPVTADMLNQKLKYIGKASKPSKDEVDINIRSRSAVMRVAEKII